MRSQFPSAPGGGGFRVMKKPGFALLSNSIPGDAILGGCPASSCCRWGAVQQRANKPLFRLCNSRARLIISTEPAAGINADGED